MLNEARVKLMTRIAAFEVGEGKRSMAIGTYFRSDYIAKEIIKSIIYGTIAFGLILGVYLVYEFETFMANLYEIDWLAFGKMLLTRYLIGIGVYALITYIVYVVRYSRARRNLQIYYNNLRRLKAMYKKEAAQADRQNSFEN